MIRITKRLALAAAASALSCAAYATPFRLEYTVSNHTGGTYRYDFQLILDNNDGSWVPGQQFDWLVLGQHPSTSTDSEGAIGFVQWLPLPNNFAAFQQAGNPAGPALRYGTAEDETPGYAPTALNQTLSFAMIARNYLGQGELLWSNLYGWEADGSELAFVQGETAVLATPVPAALPLFASVLGIGGMLGYRRRRTTRFGSRAP
jgi:hypothetical protein